MRRREALQHLVRVRTTDDLTFIRPGVMDEVLVNANQLENSPDSTATKLRQTKLPYSIDPVLTRFQMPQWWRNEKGENKRNYTRLGAAYVRGTSIKLPAGPIVETVPSDREWRTLARNVIDYQRSRLEAVPAQLDLFSDTGVAELRPARLVAPALVAFSGAEDRVNRVLALASAEEATLPLALPVIVPLARLVDRNALEQLLVTVPTDGISSYLLWTPDLTEERLLADHNCFAGVLRLIRCLSERAIPVGHMHATYAITALHDAGIAAVVHHLGWVDRGEPAHQRGGGPRSCQAYVPGVRHCLRFPQAHRLGRSLDAARYAEQFCNCAFCTGAFEAGQHPLDLLLEGHTITFKNGRQRDTPTGRAVTLNTWHYLLSRRQEIAAFSQSAATDVIANDLRRAAALADRGGLARLSRLAEELRSA